MKGKSRSREQIRRCFDLNPRRESSPASESRGSEHLHTFGWISLKFSSTTMQTHLDIIAFESDPNTAAKNVVNVAAA